MDADTQQAIEQVREALDTLYHYTVEPKSNPGRTHVRQEARNALALVEARLAEVDERLLAENERETFGESRHPS